MNYATDKMIHGFKNNSVIIEIINEVARWEGKKMQGNEQVEKKKFQKNDFKNWIMPEEPEGYLKAKSNDFL